MEKTYKFLGYFLIILIPLTFAGFYQTYFKGFPRFDENIDTYVHFHAFIALVWILMLISQPILILNKKFKLHRKIGRLSFIVFPFLILSFIPRMIRIIQMEELRIIFFPLADCVLLILFYLLAIYNRKTTAKHMRYMIATAIVFLGPTVGRIGPYLLAWGDVLTQSVQYLITFLILISLIIYDKRNSREYKPYIVASAGYFFHALVFYLIFL